MAKNVYNDRTFLRGRIGLQVYRLVKGQQVVSPWTPPANPNTDAQKLVRSKFSMITEVAGIFTEANKLGFKHYAQARHSNGNAQFVRFNYNKMNGSTPGDLTIDPSALVCSMGHLQGVIFKSAIDVTSVPNTVGVNVTDSQSTAPGAKASDEVRVFVYCPDANGGVLSVAAARAAGKIEVPVPASWSGLDVHVYGFTIGDSKNSPTEYIGHVTLN